jgi:hypothetical protein
MIPTQTGFHDAVTISRLPEDNQARNMLSRDVNFARDGSSRFSFLLPLKIRPAMVHSV